MNFQEKIESLKLNDSCSTCGGIISLEDQNIERAKICHCSQNTPPTAAESGDDEADNSTCHTSEPHTHDIPEVNPNVFGDQYQIVEIIGRGGAATVYRVRDKTRVTDLAAKVMHMHLLDDPRAVQRFHQEAAAARRLDHPNLARVYGHGLTADGAPYILMEYIEGRSLASLLSEHHHLSVGQALQIFDQIAAALEYAHGTGLVHRDIKPANILLQPDGSDWHVKVVDFGIAKVIAEQDPGHHKLTQTGDIFGSPAYMSPEQCLGASVDERTDIYSFGCVMAEVLTGRNPFYSSSPVKAIMNHLQHEPEPFDMEYKHLQIPAKLESIIGKCIRKKPENRIQKVKELRGSLKKMCAEVTRAPDPAQRCVVLLLDVLVFLVVAALVPMKISSGFYLGVAAISYICLFECSKLRATPGMLAFGLKAVYDDDAKRNALRSLARASILMASACCLFFLANALTCVAAIAKCVLVNSNCCILLFPLLVLGNLISGFVRKDKRTWFDAKTGRLVVKKNQLSTAIDTAPWALLHRNAGAVVAASLVLAVVAFFGSGILEQWTMTFPGVATANAVFAKRNIPAGQTLKRDDLVVRKRLSANIPGDAYQSIDDAVGQKVDLLDIYADDVITDRDVVSKDAK